MKHENFGDIILVMSGVKPACLLGFNNMEEFEYIKNKINKINKLSYLHYYIKSKKSIEYYILLSKSLTLIKLFNFILTKKNYTTPTFRYALGIVCGFPTCCIDNFRDCKYDIVRAYKKYKEKLGNKKDPYNLEFKVELYGKAEITRVKHDVIGHIPCSPDCVETRRIYKRYKSILLRAIKCQE